MKIDPKVALKSLEGSKQRFNEVFAHGSLSVEVYKPIGQDNQTPHTWDEVYVIISGTGTFSKGGELYNFEAGDFLFVPAGMEHRFETFTDDFATWVIFYGPEGGEKTS